MAFQISHTDSTGTLRSQAYWRVDRFIEYDFLSKLVVLQIGYYNSVRDKTREPYYRQKYSCAGEAFDRYFGTSVYSLSQTNPRKQAYEYLKTLPDFTGAIDA